MNDDIQKKNPVYSKTDSTKVNLIEEEWKQILPEDVYYVARMKGTERPWTSKFEDFFELSFDCKPYAIKQHPARLNYSILTSISCILSIFRN